MGQHGWELISTPIGVGRETFSKKKFKNNWSSTLIYIGLNTILIRKRYNSITFI